MVKSFESFLREIPDYENTLTEAQKARLEKLYVEYASWQKVADKNWDMQFNNNLAEIDYSTDWNKNSERAYQCEKALENEIFAITHNLTDEATITNTNDEEKIGMNM